MEVFPFLIKLPWWICQGQFVPWHYASPPCIVLPEKHTPTYANRRYLVLFFPASKKNCHRHGFDDISLISLLCSRAKSSKKLFYIELATWVKPLYIFVVGNFLLDYKCKDITAKHQDERIVGSTYRIYSCHFPGSRHFFFHKSMEKIRLGGGGRGLTGTPIDMSSFYLLNKSLLFSELRRHSETTLHHGVSPLANENV